MHQMHHQYTTSPCLTQEPERVPPVSVMTTADSIGQFPDHHLCGGVVDLVAGYMDCMEEALRYLIEEEKYPEHHPAVQGLRDHLAQLLNQALLEQNQAVTPAA